jgi:hypothetical protein
MFGWNIIESSAVHPILGQAFHGVRTPVLKAGHQHGIKSLVGILFGFCHPDVMQSHLAKASRFGLSGWEDSRSYYGTATILQALVRP